MKRILQITLPLVLVCLTAVIVFLILNSAEPPEKRRFVAPRPQVEVRPLQEQDFRVTLHSQGTVRARTESSLIPEVRGRILSIADNFQEGAFFEKGDILLTIDDRDYQAELVVAQADLAQQELNLLQEEARYEQASRDWTRLNPNEKASSLTLREPQLKQAKSAVASAKARVDTAIANLERTKVRAPYAGRVLTKSVDVGQYVSVGNELARIYAVDYAEVRLPLTASQYAFLDLPSVYRGEDPEIEHGPNVVIKSAVGGRQFEWNGRVVRSEGSVDTRTRQMWVVAQVENPYGQSVPGRPPLKVGSFVQAEIEGTTLHDVYVVPRKLYRENSYVLIVGEDESLQRRQVDVVWENDESIIVNEGLSHGELLCLTDVPYALEGGLVLARREGEEPAPMIAPNAAGQRIDRILAAVGDRLPDQLRTKLVDCRDNKDWAGLREAMADVSAWAKQNGVELPGGGPNSRS